MDADQITQVYAVVCSTWEREPSDAALIGWQLVLSRLDPVKVWAAMEIVIADNEYPPKPHDIVAVVRRLDGDIPPSVDAALGLYLAGDWSHPLVAAAAKEAYWDPDDPQKGTEARMRFRGAYAAAVEQHEDDKLRPAREAISGGGAELLQLLGGQGSR